MRHLTVAIPYCLAGGLFLFVGMAKLDHAAYSQAIICLTVGGCFSFVGMQQMRLWQHR